MQRIQVRYNDKKNHTNDFSLELNLDAIVSHIPGTFWWYDSNFVESTQIVKRYYWLKIPDHALSGANEHTNVHSERLLAKLMVLHYNESINILGIELTPKNIDQVICIDSYVPENGGHWKILWHDLRQQLRFGISLEDKCTQMVSEKPMQLGPGLRLIGWVSGHSYSTNANDDTVPGAETYNWCFLIPIKLDNLHNVTVFLLLPPETKAVTNTPPTQLLESTRLGEVGEYINQLNTSKYEVLKTKRADINHFKQLQQTKTFDFTTSNNNNNSIFFTSSLFGSKTRLAIITQPYNFQEQLYIHSMELDSVCSLDSLDYRCRAVDNRKFNQYTYIKTQNGRPVYRNGAYISEARKSCQEEPIEYDNDDKHFDDQPFIIDHIKNMNLNERHFVSCIKHHVTISYDSTKLSMDKDVNRLDAKCYTEIYPLEELEVVCSKQTIPPPWLSGVNKSGNTSHTNNSQSESDQSAVFTSSDLSISMIEPDEIHIRSSKIDGKQNIPDSLTVNSVFSNPTEEYENRTNLLTNLLGEINLLSQIVLNSQHENQAQIYDIHEVCKRILQGLTDLLNEEEDEEDICDQEFTFSSHQLIEPKEPIHGTSLNGANVNVNKQNVTSAICVPLPAACRVKSPIRLLVFYFEILSELMELKDHENKCLEDNQEDLSTLMDISAGILRLLDVGDSNDKNINDTDSTRGNAGSTTNLSVYTTCETALHTLIRLQDAWIAAPVLVEMLSTTKCSQSTDDGGGGVVSHSVEMHETVKLYLTRIQSALNKQRCELKNIISKDLCTFLNRSADATAGEGENSVESFENLCKLVVDSSLANGLESEKELFHSVKYDVNELFKRVSKEWDDLPFPIVDLWKKQRKVVCVTNDSDSTEYQEELNTTWKLLPNMNDNQNWEQFYRCIKFHVECLTNYLNEMKCFITVADTTKIVSSSLSATTDITYANTGQTLNYPVVHLLESSKTDLLNTDWQQSQLNHIENEREILQSNFNELSVLADFLNVLLLSPLSASSSSSTVLIINDGKKRKQWLELINQMRLISSRAFEQYTCLGFLKQIIRRPGGLLDLSNFITELLNRLLVGSQSHNWSESELYSYEIAIRHLSHQIWIESATINDLTAEHSKKTENMSINNFLEAWIYRIQETYRLVIDQWTDKMDQFQNSLHVIVIDQWCDYTTNCINEFKSSEIFQNEHSSTPSSYSSSMHDHQHSQERQQQQINEASKKKNHFALLWSLLCDAEMIQEKCSIHLEKCSSKGMRFMQILRELKQHLNEHIKVFASSSSSSAVPQSTPFDINSANISHLVQQLEYSLHSLPGHYRIFWLELPTDTGIITHQSDQLRVTLQDLRYLHNLCERNCMLCKQSLSLLHKLSLSSLDQHGSEVVKNMLQLLNTWNYGYFIIRQSLERVIRAGEVVESERYPLRTLNASELRSEAIQMLKQKQAFIEAVQFGLETIRLQMKSTSIKLHEYDSTSKVINLKTKYQTLLELLKTLYHNILDDDRLKTTRTNEIPDNDFNCLVIVRTNQAIELCQLCRKIDQTNWIISWKGFNEFTNEATINEQGNSKRWIMYFLHHLYTFSSRINLDEMYLCQINQLETTMHEWSEWIKKYVWPLPFPYPKNYSWTPITITTIPLIMNILSQHIEYEKSLKMDCQNLTSKINHKLMNLSNFYQNNIKNKLLFNYKNDDEGKSGGSLRNDRRLENSMELLDVNYPNVFLNEIHNLCQSTSLQPSRTFLTIINSNESKQMICQCSILQQIIENRLLKIQSRLVYSDHLTLVMIEQILFDLFEIKFPNQKILTGDSKSDKLWMNIYNQCMKYVRNGFLKCFCNMLTTDLNSITSTTATSQYSNEFDIPGSISFSERWHNKLEVDKLFRNSSESEKQLLFFNHLLVLFNLYDTWQNIVKLAGSIMSSKKSSVYNPILLHWVLTTRPKVVESILSYSTHKISYTYQCSQCVCKGIHEILFSIDEAELNNLFRKFASHSGCIDYLLMESIQNLSDKITYCIQKIDNHHIQVGNLLRLKPTDDQDDGMMNVLLKGIDSIRPNDLKTLNLRQTLSRWHEILMSKLECGRKFKNVLANCAEKFNSLISNVQTADNMETTDCVEIEKRLLHLQVIKDETNKILHDLQTIEFRTSISHSINFINLVNLIIVLRQQDIVQHILDSRLKYYLSELQNPSTIHRRIVHLFKLGRDNCQQITNKLICLLNFTRSINDTTYRINDDNKESMDCEYLEKPLFKMHMKSPEHGALEQLFLKLSLVDKYCTEAQEYLRQQFTWFPLKSGMFSNQHEQMIGSSGSEVYLNELTNQLVISLLCPSVVKTKIEALIGESEKLRNILSAFADSINEMSAFRDQLCIAIPQLTGYHLTNLTKAVDELELWASSNLNESHFPTDPVEKRHPQLGAQLKHAGQRLMELETCLEHSREAASILVFFELEPRFWSSPLSSTSGKHDSSQEITKKRGQLIQTEFENSLVAIKLRTAWVKLTQLGDRLGRIQAGLPVRPTQENETELRINNVSPSPLRYPQTNPTLDNCGVPISPPLLPPRPSQSNMPTQLRSRLIKDETKRTAKWNRDDNEAVIESAPRNIISAEKLRRRQTNLRDALGSHMCVYPDCKASRDECLSMHGHQSEKQLNIENRTEWIFKKVISLHTYLQKDYNESYHYQAYQRRMCSISKNELSRLVRYSCRLRWHNSYTLQSEYQQLKVLIDELLNSEYPEVTKLQECFKSLEELWFGTVRSQENLNKYVGDSASPSSLSLSPNRNDHNSIESIYEDMRSSNIQPHQYTFRDVTVSHPPLPPLSKGASEIPHDYSVSNTQNVCHSFKDEVGNRLDVESCDLTWREMKGQGLEPQPLVFLSSPPKDHTNQTTSMIRTQDLPNTIGTQSNEQTYSSTDHLINALINELNSGTKPLEVSVNIAEDNSKSVSVDVKDAIQTDNRNNLDLNDQKMKSFLPNKVDQPLKIISDDFNQGDLPHSSIGTDEIPPKITVSTTVTTLRYSPYPYSTIAVSKTDLKPEDCESNGSDVNRKFDEKMLSDTQMSYQIPGVTTLKPMSLGVTTQTELDAYKQDSSQVYVNSHIPGSSFEVTVTEIVKLEDTNGSTDTNTNPVGKYDSHQVTFVTSDRQLPSLSTDFSTTKNSVSGINEVSQHHDDYDMVSPDSYTSISTKTTVNINLIERKSSENKSRASQTINSSTPSESYLTTSLLHSTPPDNLDFVQSSTSAPYPTTYPSSAMITSNTRRMFHQIYKCRHLHTSVIMNMDNESDSCNSMCDLCKHMSNLHTLISSLQSHLLSNRQNRLSNLLPIDIESFTQSSSLISSLSTYWSPIIKEYLSIICEIKSELNSFQSSSPSSSALEYKIIHLPEYKSMDDLLNIWNCRLQDFLCLRSSNISNSGVNIPQTRWLTLFISLIQHNEIQVEYLKSVFTSLIHFIQNENDETMKHELEVHNNEKSYLSNSCIPGIVKGESHPYHIYQHLPTEILSLSSKHQYLDDLKSRLFSHELLDQEKSMLLPRQLSPSSTHSILVVPNDNITQSLQPKTEEKDDSHRSSTVFTTTDVCMMHDEDEESQKSLEVHNSDHISFGQDLSGQIQSSGKNGKSIQNAEILKEFNGGDSDQTQWITVQKRKVKKAKKHKCKNQDQARGRKTTTETTTTTTSIINDNNTNKGDFTDNEDARDKTAENIQTHPSIYPPGVPDAVHPCGLILESKIQTAKSEDTGESEPCVDQSRISFCLRSATLNSRLLPSFHETCLRGSDEMKSYVTENDEVKSNDVLNVLLQNSSINGDNQGTIWGRGSLQTSDSIEDNGTVKDFKPNITDTNLEEKVRRHETMTYTNKSNDLASWITIQSDSSPSVTDINTVSGVNAGEKKLYRFHNISNTFPEDSKQSSRSCVTVDTEIKQEGSRSDAYSTSSDVFNREIIKPAVEFDLPVKSEKCMKADKKHFQGWLQSPTNADLKSLEPVVTCNRNSKDIDSSITGSKNVPSQPQRQIKIDFLPDKRTGRKDTNDQLDQELLPEEKKHSFPRSSVFNEAIKNDESISADVYDSHKSELYSYHPENDSDNRQTLGSNGSALVTSKFVKTITKIANSDFTSDVSLPSSSLSVSNEKDHVTHNFVSTKRKIRKVNRTAINRRQDKSIMPGELKPTAVNNQSPTNQMNNSQDQLTQHTTVSVKCKNHSESNSGASSHSSSPRLVHTLGTPTTISLKPSWSNSYQISSSSDENKIHNNIIDEVSTPVYHQHEFLRNVERYPTSVVLNTTAISSHEIAQSHSNMFSPTNNRIQREKIKLTFSTPSTSPLSLQTTDDDDSYLPTNKLNIDEHEVFKKSITGDKYHLIDTNKSLTDAEQSAFKQRTHLNRSSVCDAVTSPYDKSDSLKKRQKVDFTSLSKYHDLYSDDLDVNSSWDQHGFHSFSQHRYRDTHRNRRLRHEQQHPYHHSEQVESVRVLRQTPIIKENELLNTSLTGFKRFGSDVHISNRVHSSSPELFHPDNRMSDSFLTSNIVGYSELQRRQITSTDASGEVSSLRSGESIPAKMSKTRRRFCRLLPYLLLMLPILFLFFLILCIFFIPGCPLLLPWLKCNEKSPTGEWFYSPFVLFHVNDPPF